MNIKNRKKNITVGFFYKKYLTFQNMRYIFKIKKPIESQ